MDGTFSKEAELKALNSMNNTHYGAKFIKKTITTALLDISPNLVYN